MRPILATVVLSLVALPAAAAAQSSAGPVSGALQSMMQRMQRNLVGAAEDMPADKYGFKPTPAQMSFGQLVLHVAGSNDFMCQTISGEKAPASEKLKPDDPKDKLVARLKASFEFCNSALSKVTDDKLGDQVPFFGGRTVSRAAAMMGLAEDWGDHYSAAAVYMRLNGVLPPSARRGQSE